ncbi:hypothetical protein BOA8489_00507 [Boseongicola aestuarii]|uniref:Uncharacterized protein n=1 Tax=Boseongicola aestuarii TaxID=1470561 RepID=A0A238IWK3_9RHOB|nr:hypothetical protein BOA8489_00507 [Boseongicola aestuarii]
MSVPRRYFVGITSVFFHRAVTAPDAQQVDFGKVAQKHSQMTKGARAAPFTLFQIPNRGARQRGANKDSLGRFQLCATCFTARGRIDRHVPDDLGVLYAAGSFSEGLISGCL